MHRGWTPEVETGVGAAAAGLEHHHHYKKGLRVRNSPMCTLSQNGYGARRSELTCAEEIVLAALEAPADDTMIRASTIGHQEIQQAVAFTIGHAVMKTGPNWAATVAGGKSGARQKAQKQLCTACPAVEEE